MVVHILLAHLLGGGAKAAGAHHAGAGHGMKHRKSGGSEARKELVKEGVRTAAERDKKKKRR
jgi:hypothetical protein